MNRRLCNFPVPLVPLPPFPFRPVYWTLSAVAAIIVLWTVAAVQLADADDDVPVKNVEPDITRFDRAVFLYKKQHNGRLTAWRNAFVVERDGDLFLISEAQSPALFPSNAELGFAMHPHHTRAARLAEVSDFHSGMPWIRNDAAQLAILPLKFQIDDPALVERISKSAISADDMLLDVPGLTVQLDVVGFPVQFDRSLKRLRTVVFPCSVASREMGLADGFPVRSGFLITPALSAMYGAPAFVHHTDGNELVFAGMYWSQVAGDDNPQLGVIIPAHAIVQAIDAVHKRNN